MKEFSNFLKRSHFFILFLVFESLSIFLIIKNTGKEFIFINSANIISGTIHKNVKNISSYFSLKSENKKLLEENTKLRNLISLAQPEKQRFSVKIQDLGYFYKSAYVVKNSTDKEYNIITIDKGYFDGITEGMATISNNGTIGITGVVGKHYGTIISVLNTKLEISAKVKRTNYHGILKWDGKDYRFVNLYDIPIHSSLFKGDEIVTSGYSAIFPEGLKIGTVYDFEKDTESTFYKIKVKLSQDFKNLDYVYLIKYKDKEERTRLEDSTLTKFNFINSSVISR